MTTTTTTLSGEEGGKKTKFVFPLVPVNSYALDEVSLLSDTANINININNNITKNTTNEDDEKKANMLPIFTLQPLKKQHTDDGESNNNNNNNFIKKYGQPTCGMSADDRVFVGTNRGNLLRGEFCGRKDGCFRV